MSKTLTALFAECARAIETGVMISRVSSTDKEFSFQNWFSDRLKALKLNFDEPSRNAYPDFRLVNEPIGFEIKGLGFPGREANYDCNSQVPSGLHNGRTIYYVFGRYPAATADKEYAVFDLVICHGDFLNADHDYVHKNKNLKGFGSYGDMMVRDRKMYVAPTPYAITSGTERQITLIIPADHLAGSGLKEVGAFTRKESERLIRGYSFDMLTHAITPTYMKNPKAGLAHDFKAYRLGSSNGPAVGLK